MGVCAHGGVVAARRVMLAEELARGLGGQKACLHAALRFMLARISSHHPRPTCYPTHSQARPPPPNATSGFVETFGVGVCRGRYATALRK